jgi:hypothetical protein
MSGGLKFMPPAAPAQSAPCGCQSRSRPNVVQVFRTPSAGVSTNKQIDREHPLASAIKLCQSVHVKIIGSDCQASWGDPIRVNAIELLVQVVLLFRGKKMAQSVP